MIATAGQYLTLLCVEITYEINYSWQFSFEIKEIPCKVTKNSFCLKVYKLMIMYFWPGRVIGRTLRIRTKYKDALGTQVAFFCTYYFCADA